MKKALLIAREFPPQAGVGGQRSAKFAKYLPEFGWHPLVLTVAEEDLGPARDDSMLGELGDVEIVRCPTRDRWLVAGARKLHVYRGLKFFVRPDMDRVSWLPAARRAALRIAEAHGPQVIYTSAPPYSCVLLGAWLRRRLGIPWVVDYRDPWTDCANRVWPTRGHYWWESRQERRALATADAIVVVTPGMKRLLVERYPEYADKVQLIPNGFDPADFAPGAEPESSEVLRIAFAGTLADRGCYTAVDHFGGLARWIAEHVAFRHPPLDLSTNSPFFLLQAVRAVLDEQPQWCDRLRLVFAGSFGSKNLEIVGQLKLDRQVEVLGRLGHAESNRLLMRADVLFFPLAAPLDGSRSYICSGKLFEYMGSGRPLLAAVPDGDPRDLVERAGIGWCVPPRDVGAIKNLLVDLMHQKMAGRLSVPRDEGYIRQFQRRELTRQLAAHFDRLSGA